MINIPMKPLSVNECWQGKRFKTKAYNDYEKTMLLLLPSKQKELIGSLKIDIEYGFSSKLSDIDNPTKLVLDILVKKYRFDDRQIYELNLKKEIVKKGSEFIKIEITEIN